MGGIHKNLPENEESKQLEEQKQMGVGMLIARNTAREVFQQVRYAGTRSRITYCKFEDRLI
jgi:hypothetical protein